MNTTKQKRTLAEAFPNLTLMTPPEALTALGWTYTENPETGAYEEIVCSCGTKVEFFGIVPDLPDYVFCPHCRKTMQDVLGCRPSGSSGAVIVPENNDFDYATDPYVSQGRVWYIPKVASDK